MTEQQKQAIIESGKQYFRSIIIPNHLKNLNKLHLSSFMMNIKKVRVDKEGTGMGWGAVYAQYLGSMDQIGEQGNGLSVSRQLYKGNQALNESAPLKVGDKITVRLTVIPQ